MITRLNSKPTNVFLHFFPAEGFYKVTTSASSSDAYNGGWDDKAQLIWETTFPSRTDADSFKWHVLKGRSKFKPVNEPKIKSSQTTYKGDPIDLNKELNEFSRPEDIPTWVYLAKLPEDDTYKVGFSGTNPENGVLKNFLVWVSKASSRQKAESLSAYIYSECAESYHSAPDRYNFRQTFVANKDISVFKDVLAEWLLWLDSKPAAKQEERVVEEF